VPGGGAGLREPDDGKPDLTISDEDAEFIEEVYEKAEEETGITVEDD
jgi:hypothetical protein